MTEQKGTIHDNHLYFIYFRYTSKTLVFVMIKPIRVQILPYSLYGRRPDSAKLLSASQSNLKPSSQKKKKILIPFCCFELISDHILLQTQFTQKKKENKQKMHQASHHDLVSSSTKPETETSTNWFLIAFIGQHHNAFLILIYIANIVLTGVVGSICLFATEKAPVFVFHEAYGVNDSMRIIGAFWLAIGIVSAMGIFNPIKFTPILIVQIIYKGLYLLVEVLPKLIKNQQIPIGVACFFLAWVILLPLVVPWKSLFIK